jgi:hypothetical protein
VELGKLTYEVIIRRDNTPVIYREFESPVDAMSFIKDIALKVASLLEKMDEKELNMLIEELRIRDDVRRYMMRRKRA